MQLLYPDLWQSAAERPAPSVPDLVTRCYLLATEAGNLLIYSTGLEAELVAMRALGGVARQYLSHVDEAGPALARIRALYGAELWGHAAEAAAVARKAGLVPDRTFERAETHLDRLEILPLPGHSPGSTCFLYRSPHGRRYLFTGDTIGLDRQGRWRAGYIPGYSDAAALLSSLEALAGLAPDVVLSSAFGEPHPCREVDAAGWQEAVRSAAADLRARSGRG